MKEDSQRRKVKMSGIHRVLPLMAKSTNGIISTVAGASMFVAMPIADSSSGQEVDLKLKYFKKENKDNLSLEDLFLNFCQ